jgi:carotene epsilon-monooxygenase
MQKLIDTAGAGASFTSPGWLTQLGRLWGGAADAPVADAKPDDIKDLLGGALFKALYKWMEESGPIYLLPTGPASSFLVVSDPAAAKHVLRATDNPANPVYEKGLVAEVSSFLFGDGFAITGGDAWRVRRRAVGPALHRAYLDAMVGQVFAPASDVLAAKLRAAAATGAPIDLEACFSQLTLDIIGKAVFNHDFASLQSSSPVIQAVYTALKETESRATDVLPLWRWPAVAWLSPRQKAASAAVKIIRDTTEDLVARCKALVDAEAAGTIDLNDPAAAADATPSVLRFLIAARDDVDSTQLRDDLLSMLVAGHETTASVLTWTLYELMRAPACAAEARAEVDAVLAGTAGGALASAADVAALRYVTRCVNESMRLYPHPPVLLRRARAPDTLPGGVSVPVGQDVMISVYNIHRSPAVWPDAPNAFNPARFGPLADPHPNETNTDYRFIPFSGGPRKCVGDAFATMESVTALASLIAQFDFTPVPGREDPGMTTGATIHTKNGLWVTVKERAGGAGVGAAAAAAASVASA